MFDVAVDGPLEYVKESLKVRLRVGARASISGSSADDGYQSGGSNASIASSCFDQATAIQNQGSDESDIRAVISTTYVGESPYSCGGRTTHTDQAVPAAADTEKVQILDALNAHLS